MKFIIFLKIILHNIFCKNNNCKAQKLEMIPKIKCTILLEQLYECTIILIPKCPKVGHYNVLSLVFIPT